MADENPLYSIANAPRPDGLISFATSGRSYVDLGPRAARPCAPRAGNGVS